MVLMNAWKWMWSRGIKMKKLLITICSVFAIMTAPLFAFEWGGLVTNDSGIYTTDFSDITFNQSNGISAWFRAPFGAQNDFNISGEFLYKYKLSKPKAADASLTHIIDISLLKFSGETQAGSGLLSINAGRFSYVDGTGAVFAQVVDGASVEYALPSIKIGAFAGYTGLLNTLTSGMLSSSATESKFYNFAYACAPLGLSVEFPYLIGNQTLGFAAYAVLDCASSASSNYYANLILSGPVTNSIYYNLTSTFGSTNFKTLMNSSAFSLMIFPTASLSLNAGVDFGSGEQGKLSTFTSLSSKASEVAGAIIPKAGLTFGTDVMCFDLGAKYILSYADDKYSGSGADINTGFVYNVFSDLQFGLNLTAHFDTTAAKANYYIANLNVSLAF